MMPIGWRGLFNRRIGYTLLWMLLLLVVATILNLAGIHALGGIERWQGWMADHAGYWLVWRLMLYAAMAYGWRWMRRRVLARETDPQAQLRLIRVEIAGIVALLALEACLLLQPT